MSENTRRGDSALRVLPTKYASFTFRSRTEARWAVFLDALDVKWDYEREGFEFNGQRYLPDFWLPEQEKWLEVKGAIPTADELAKAEWLSDGTNYDVLIAYGEPRCPDGSAAPGDDSMWVVGLDLWDDSYWWTECPHCGCIDAAYMGRSARLRCRCVVNRDPGEDKAYNYKTARLACAYQAARTAFTGPSFRGSRA